MSKSGLQFANLTETEATIYRLLLKVGQVPVQRILKEGEFKRATVYSVLSTLEKKGLVKASVVGKKMYFKPESPTKLVEIADRSVEEANQVKDSISSMLPELSTLYTASTELPVVQTYQGIEGAKRVYLDTLRVGEPIRVVLQNSFIEKDLTDWINTVYAKKRAKLKIHSKMIVFDESWVKEFKKQDVKLYRTTRVVTRNILPSFQAEINIYGDKVAYVYYKKNEPILSVVITHPQIAESMRVIFELAWIGAA